MDNHIYTENEIVEACVQMKIGDEKKFFVGDSWDHARTSPLTFKIAQARYDAEKRK